MTTIKQQYEKPENWDLKQYTIQELRKIAEFYNLSKIEQLESGNVFGHKKKMVENFDPGWVRLSEKKIKKALDSK